MKKSKVNTSISDGSDLLLHRCPKTYVMTIILHVINNWLNLLEGRRGFTLNQHFL